MKTLKTIIRKPLRSKARNKDRKVEDIIRWRSKRRRINQERLTHIAEDAEGN